MNHLNAIIVLLIRHELYYLYGKDNGIHIKKRAS